MKSFPHSACRLQPYLCLLLTSRRRTLVARSHGDRRSGNPLALVIFGRLPDRGYAFTKMFGLLIVSYLFWITGSLGFIGNNPAAS